MRFKNTSHPCETACLCVQLHEFWIKFTLAMRPSIFKFILYSDRDRLGSIYIYRNCIHDARLHVLGCRQTWRTCDVHIQCQTIWLPHVVSSVKILQIINIMCAHFCYETIKNFRLQASIWNCVCVCVWADGTMEGVGSEGGASNQSIQCVSVIRLNCTWKIIRALMQKWSGVGAHADTIYTRK